MKKFTIRLKEINDVKEFVNTVSRFEEDVDLVSGRYTIDAKSIMGIFSIDLAKPIEVIVHGDNEARYAEALKAYII
ncbi:MULTISPECIES: HPr family phosphocarrier protein [Anaerotruncus]|uniref:HPr family phosphocarrier protein n=1 Tax=Anaerotruncus TaxID=244127 RepID=UPI00210E18AE|nr:MULTISPECIES: HPr family phosphocarrier protein [Anaerotruncus]MCQ4894302.1 HPr family phosphocarrier protein [Anaerotruncus sp. DFI.9.16]